MALSFELARLAGAYDYKTWSRNLVGPFWWLVDILILSMMMLVIAVMTAAIGEVLQQTLALPKPVSLAFALVCVGFLSWRGSGFIEKAKTWGSAALYLGYCAFAVLVLTAPVEAAAAGPVAATAATAPVIVADRWREAELAPPRPAFSRSPRGSGDSGPSARDRGL